jgi:hypothetical protein
MIIDFLLIIKLELFTHLHMNYLYSKVEAKWRQSGGKVEAKWRQSGGKVEAKGYNILERASI